MILSIKIHAPRPDTSWDDFFCIAMKKTLHTYTINVYMYSCESRFIKQNYFYQVHEHIVFPWHSPFSKGTDLDKSLDNIPRNKF